VNNEAEHYNHHRFPFDVEHFDFIDYLLADIDYLFHVAEHVEGGVSSPYPMGRVSEAVNKWPACTTLPG
jgi:hypothetical protein